MMKKSLKLWDVVFQILRYKMPVKCFSSFHNTMTLIFCFIVRVRAHVQLYVDILPEVLFAFVSEIEGSLYVLRQS